MLIQITLPPDLENFVQDQVGSGKYGDSAEDVIVAALELLRQQDSTYQEWLLGVKRDVQIGLEDYEKGRSVDGSTAIAQVRERLRDRYKPSEE